MWSQQGAHLASRGRLPSADLPKQDAKAEDVCEQWAQGQHVDVLCKLQLLAPAGLGKPARAGCQALNSLREQARGTNVAGCNRRRRARGTNTHALGNQRLLLGVNPRVCKRLAHAADSLPRLHLICYGRYCELGKGSCKDASGLGLVVRYALACQGRRLAAGPHLLSRWSPGPAAPPGRTAGRQGVPHTKSHTQRSTSSELHPKGATLQQTLLLPCPRQHFRAACYSHSRRCQAGLPGCSAHQTSSPCRINHMCSRQSADE